MVTMVPTSSATMMVRGLSTTVPCGRSCSKALNSAVDALRGDDPERTGPTIEAMSPTISASSSTERSTCRREAPIVRSSANSLVRCATVIEKVLKMMNAPTNSAMPANTSSSVLRKLRLSLDRVGLSSASCSPVFTSTVSRQHAVAASRDQLPPGSRPRRAATWIESSLPRWSRDRCASGSVTTEIVAPPSELDVAELGEARDP